MILTIRKPGQVEDDELVVLLDREDLIQLATYGVQRTKSELLARGVPEEVQHEYQRRCHELMSQGMPVEQAARQAYNELMDRRPDLRPESG